MFRLKPYTGVLVTTNGGISTVSSVDEKVHSILGIITTYTTTVRGN